MTVAGLMRKSKYSHNILRTGDIMTDAPFTVLNSEMHNTTIQLPLPTNLSSSMGANWQQEQVSKLSMLGRHNKKEIGEIIGSYKDGLGGKMDKVLAGIINRGNQDVQELWARSKKTSSLLGGARIATNPNNEMLFNGMSFKSYSFSFTLVPYRQKDSDDIQKAIREIQKASAPEMRGEKMFMEYPETWWITFMSGSDSGNDYLMKLNECCCTNVGVNYTPQGDSRNMHDKNAPLSVELTLDFTEIYIPTKETIEDYNG